MIGRPERALLAVLVPALLLRLAAAAWQWRVSPVDDALAYEAVARNLVAGRGFSTEEAIGLVNPGGNAPTSLWGCLQPLWIAGHYALFGPHPGAVYVANAALGLVPVVVAWLLAAAAGGPRAALVAAGLVAADPYLIRFGASLLTEALYVALLWPGLWLLLRWVKGGGLADAASSGLLLALAALTRGTAFYLALAVVAWAAVERRRAGRGGALRGAAVVLLALAAGIAPWVARNRRVHGTQVFLDTKAAWNLYSYLHPDYDPWQGTHPPVPADTMRPGATEAERDRAFRRHAWEQFRADPWRVVRLAPAKLWLLWSPFPTDRTTPLAAPVKALFLLPLELCAAWGLARSRLAAPEVRLVLVVAGVYVALHAVMTGAPRFRTPLDPGLSVLAGLALFGGGGSGGIRRRGAESLAFQGLAGDWTGAGESSMISASIRPGQHREERARQRERAISGAVDGAARERNVVRWPVPFRTEPAAERSTMRRSERGTTLTEVLVMLGILALLTLISVPSLMNALQSMEARGAASAIATGIRRTQSLALQNHQTYSIVFKPENGSTNPTFCWNPPYSSPMYAIVKDSGGDCKVTSCSSPPESVVEWGPRLPTAMTWVRMPSGDARDIGGSSGTAYYSTLCFNSRGYVPTSLGLTVGNGLYIGNTIRKIYRRVGVEITGRAYIQRYVGSSYVDQ